MNSEPFNINVLYCQIKTNYRPLGERLLRSYLFQSDSLKKVFYQVAQKINYSGQINTDKLVLNLGTITSTQFVTQFDQRLAQAFAESLLALLKEARQQPKELPALSRPVQPQELLAGLNPDPAALTPLALCCLQPSALQQLLQQPTQLQQLLKLLLNHSGLYQQTLAPAFYRRVTASRLSIAALRYVLNDPQGLRWLTENAPSLSQLNSWTEAIAAGEIATEQVVQLLTGQGPSAQVTTRWLLPLWQRKTVRNQIRKRSGKDIVQQIDDRLYHSEAQARRVKLGEEWPETLAQNVSNAGIVLLWPLLPQLFSLLALTADRQFISDNACWQGVISLHYLVWATENADAKSMPVNQLLCGIPADSALPEIMPLREAQQQQIDSWLTAVSQQLPAWQKFSLADIRQLFLQRPGEIIPETRPPQIVVRPESFDLLLGDWPWPLTLASLPWLEQPLTIGWPFNGPTG